MATRMSKYPHGFDEGVLIRDLPLVQLYAGETFYVGNHPTLLKGEVAASDSNKGTFHAPFSTLDYAVSRCKANRGDRIVLRPNHTETVSAAAGIDLDVAGIIVIGLGMGENRPAITLDTAAAADIDVAAANISIHNVLFKSDFEDIANVFNLTATDFTLSHCEFRSPTADKNFIALIQTNTTDNSADRLTIEHCKWVEPDTSTNSMVDIDGDLDSLTVKNCYANLGVNTNDVPIVGFVATGKDVTNIRIENNVFIRLNDANELLVDPDTTSANTGAFVGNKIRHADTAAEILIATGSPILMAENYASAVDDASGYLLPAADS